MVKQIQICHGGSKYPLQNMLLSPARINWPFLLVFMRGSVLLMRGSCAGKFDSLYGVFIFPVAKLKHNKFENKQNFNVVIFFILNLKNELPVPDEL